MELSQLLAGNASTASLPLGKGDGKASGNGDAEFARLFKQAGEVNKNMAEATTATTAASDKGSLAGSSGKAPLQDAQLDDESTTQAELIAALPSELAPLAQQVVQAIEGGLSGNAQSQNQQNGGLTPIQGENGSPIATALSPLAAGDGEPLTDIRQRMDMIASAQRGDTLPAQQGEKLAVNAAQLVTDANGKPGNNERAMATSAQTGGLRHQQLTAQGMQTLAQQETTVQAAAQPSGTFADAITAISTDESALPTRHGSDNSFSPSLMGTTAPTGNPANASNASMPTPGQLTPTLTAPLASAQWQQGLGQQLLALHQRGGQQVELHLHPTELGPLSISLKVDDQLAQAQFFSANPQVRAAVEQAIPQLREALEESGIQLGEAMVGEHHQRDDGRDQAPNGHAMAGLASDARATSSGDDTAAAQVTTGTSLDSNAIDLYA